MKTLVLYNHIGIKMKIIYKLEVQVILIVLMTGFALGQNLLFDSQTWTNATSSVTIDLGKDTNEMIPSYMPGGDEFRIIAIQFEGTWTSTSLTVSASSSASGDYDDVFEQDGTAVTIKMASDRYVILDPKFYAGLRYIKLTGSSEGGARTYVLIKRQY